MRKTLAILFAGCAVLCAAVQASADTTVKVNPDSPWVGFMNVFELPSNGGGYVFGSGWGVPDLTAVFSGEELTLGPNSVGDPNPFWYTPAGGPGSTGNKTMDANMYVEVTGGLSGQNVTFKGNVLANSLVAPYTSVAFIKDFAPNYASFNIVTVALTPGPFSINMATLAAPGRHVQYGFETIGPNVWITDVGPYGNVRIAAVPEPASVAMMALGLVSLVGVGRRRAKR